EVEGGPACVGGCDAGGAHALLPRWPLRAAIGMGSSRGTELRRGADAGCAKSGRRFSEKIEGAMSIFVDSLKIYAIIICRWKEAHKSTSGFKRPGGSG